jgi:hypothetical protein
MGKRIGLATVTNVGILFNEIYFTCSRAIRDKWFELAWVNGSWEIVILYDHTDLSRIYLNDHMLEEKEVCNVIVRQSESGEKLERYFESIQKLKVLRSSAIISNI